MLPYSYLFHELAAKPDREADQVRDAVERMISDIKRTTSYGDVLADPIHLKQAKTFHYIVRQLAAVSFEDSGLDYKGAAFEYFVRATLKGKKLGQYFTPRPLVELMALLVGREAIVNAAIANQPTKVLDPACGTGGFLVFMLKSALRQLKERLDSKSISQSLYEKAALRLKAEIFFGSDANDGVAAAAKMNMIIAGDGHTNIRPEDSLRVGSKSWDVALPDCDYILTNPPFGTSESESLPSIELAQYPVRTTKGQNLFLQKMIQCTKPGGYICTVIDDGVLNTESAASLRRYLLEECRLLLVVQLPSETFKPNKINVRSSVLLLQRRVKPDRPASDKSLVVFCSLDSLGYDGSGEKIRGFDMSALLQDFDHKVMAPKKTGPRSGVHWSAFDVPMINIADDSAARMDLKYWEPSVIDRIDMLRSDHGQAVRSLNLVSTRRGKSPPADVYVDENDGFALVVKAGSNINSHGLLQTDASSDYIEKSVYDDLPEHCKIQQGDVLLSSTGDGTLGKACVYDREGPAIADGHVTIIRVDQSTMDPYFLADYLRCGFGADQISRLYTGSTGLIELTPEHVNEIVVPNLKHAAQVKASKLIRKAESDFRGGITQANAALLAARTNFVAVI
ncbi:N-6 DNA methylase [Xanthomonas phaseoli]|uniref:N-6 DNA methylase n=1 Tax=Xanthomonas phaseoli TaxID=1985254 RepID=UPI0002D72A1A|nr:N-6 DNA methylase [Xanthomonas phaseoli]